MCLHFPGFFHSHSLLVFCKALLKVHLACKEVGVPAKAFGHLGPNKKGRASQPSRPMSERSQSKKTPSMARGVVLDLWPLEHNDSFFSANLHGLKFEFTKTFLLTSLQLPSA